MEKVWKIGDKVHVPALGFYQAVTYIHVVVVVYKYNFILDNIILHNELICL